MSSGTSTSTVSGAHLGVGDLAEPIGIEALPLPIDAPPARHLRKQAGHKTEVDCMVSGCTNLLGSRYEKRYRLCSPHMKSPQFLIGGSLHRWCQKCGKFHSLSDFDGMRKSCRVSLERHNEKQKQARVRRQVSEAAQAAVSAAPGYHWDAAAAFLAPVELPLAPVAIPLAADSGSLSLTSSDGASPSSSLTPPTGMVVVEVACLSDAPWADAAAAARPPGATWAAPAAQLAVPQRGGAAAAPALPTAEQQRLQEIMEIDAFSCDLLLDPTVSLEAFGIEDFDAGAMPPVLDMSIPCGRAAAPATLPPWLI